jgi:hypothetical protein
MHQGVDVAGVEGEVDAPDGVGEPFDLQAGTAVRRIKRALVAGAIDLPIDRFQA